VTPFRRIVRHGNLIDVRRMLGVGTFCYIAAHLALFFADQSYSPAKFFHEITHRVYLIIGAIAWLGLAALAATSTDGMVRRLGGLRWRRLHQAIYAIALLGLIHYFQQTKADVTVPTFAASLFLWLIGYRVLAWWQGTSELSPLSLLGLMIVVSLLTFAGEAIGIGIAFHVSPLRVLETVFDFDAGSGNERLMLCGNSFLTSLNKLAKAGMQVRTDEVVRLYGMQLQRWIIPQGTFYLRTHPLMNVMPGYTKCAFIIDPSALKYRYLQDTISQDQIQANDADEHKGQWLTECGLEVRHEKTLGFLSNFFA